MCSCREILAIPVAVLLSFTLALRKTVPAIWSNAIQCCNVNTPYTRHSSGHFRDGFCRRSIDWPILLVWHNRESYVYATQYTPTPSKLRWRNVTTLPPSVARHKTSVAVFYSRVYPEGVTGLNPQLHLQFLNCVYVQKYCLGSVSPR